MVGADPKNAMVTHTHAHTHSLKHSRTHTCTQMHAHMHTYNKGCCLSVAEEQGLLVVDALRQSCHRSARAVKTPSQASPTTASVLSVLL